MEISVTCVTLFAQGSAWILLLSGLSGHLREPEVPMHRLVVRKSFLHLCGSALLLLGLFHPHCWWHALPCAVANCFCGLVSPSSTKCHHRLGCGAPGSTLSSLVTSGCILVSTLSRTVRPCIEPSSISIGLTSPVKQALLGGARVEVSFASIMLVVLTGEVRPCWTVWQRWVGS